MVAGGNTPLQLYAQVAQRRLPLSHLNIFALDEYIGVPRREPRNCANQLRQAVVEAWNVPSTQYWFLSSSEREAAESIGQYEETIRSLGGLDVIILGLGRNGHIGFNEPGSDQDSVGRVVPLSEVSVDANRRRFVGEYAPTRGVTTGMRTILSARSLMLLAFGALKADAVVGMIEGEQAPSCPASYLRSHPSAFVFLDEQAASKLTNRRGVTGTSSSVTTG
jgi:glucosamine-6-phosphate deaminase